MNGQLIKFPIAIFLAVVVSCCTAMRNYNVNVTEIGPYPEPLFKPLPITLGVYYKDEFKNFQAIHKYAPPDEGICNTHIGEANIALFEYILPNVAETVIPVEYLPLEQEDLEAFDLILEPTVRDYDYIIADDSVEVKLVYKIRFHYFMSNDLSFWNIEGSSIMPKIMNETKDEYHIVTELTQLAMREVAAKFISGFCSHPDIRKMQHEQCAL